MGAVGLWIGLWGWCVVAVVVGSLGVGAECPHEPTGLALRRWSEASEWSGGAKPASGAAVVITDDVLLDESPPELASVTVEAGGSLVFSPEGDFTLATKYLMLHGALHIGSDDCRFTATAKILLTGTRGEYNITGYGEKFIGVGEGAALELHGQNKLAWAKLTSTVPKLTSDNGLIYSFRNDAVMPKSTRGMISFVINGTTGEFSYRKTVCFMGSSRRNTEPATLVAALDGADDGDIVILAVNWNVISDEIDIGPVYDAIDRLVHGKVTSSSTVRQIKEYDAWSLVAVKGQWVKEELVSRVDFDRLKVARVTAVLPGDHVVSVVSKTKPSHYQAGKSEVTVTTLDAGSRILTLSHDATTWRPGDKLLVTSTDFEWSQAEEAEVAYCSPQDCANNQVRALFVNMYMHYGEITEGVDERAEVALLSRNIIIEGAVQDACDESNGNCESFFHDSFGGHIRVEAGFSSLHVEGAWLRNMGQPMEKGGGGRHPIFFHQCGDVDAQGNYSRPATVASTSITHSFDKGIVLSGTHGLRIQDNVIYDHYSHGIMLKEGGEKRTVIDGNLVASSRELFLSDPLDRMATSYIITNPQTYFRNNVAAGGMKRGVWFLFPYEPVGESADKGFMQRDEAMRTALLEFDNNAIHSYRHNGLTMDHRLRPDGTNSEGIWTYSPKVDPLDKDSVDEPCYVTKLTVFKNRERDAWIRGGYIIVEDSSFADSVVGLTFARNMKRELFLRNSVIVGESANIGEPTMFWDGANKVIVPLSRSLPYYWDLRRPIQGFQSAEGPNYLHNVWFNNFPPNDNRTSAAVSFLPNWYWPSSAVNHVTSLAFGFDDDETSGLRLFNGNSSHYAFGDRDGDLQLTLRDKDGSLTGSAGSTVLRNYPFYTTDRCYYRDVWNLAVCPHKYGKLRVQGHGAGDGRSPPVMTRDDLSVDQGLEMPNKYQVQFPVILGGSHSYVLHWPQGMPDWVAFTGNGFEKDYGVRFGMCVPRNAELQLWSHSPEWRPRMDTWTEVSSVYKLDRDQEGDRYFWDKTNGIIFFKMINPRTRCEDFGGECKGGCPYLKVTVTSGDMSDSDCRDRIGAYARQPIDGTGALTYEPLSATPMPSGVGARDFVPFPSRPSVDGGQGQWSSWGQCSTTCGGGTQIRTRPCDSPMPQHDGQACEGPREEVRVCGTTSCEIAGGLSAWAPWTSCQKLPDNGRRGQQTRARQCDAPAPQHNGAFCTGVTRQMQGCQTAESDHTSLM